MFQHHGLGSRRLQHDLPGETGRISLPPLWVGPVLAHQPGGDPAPTGTPSPAVTFTPEQQAAMDRIIEDRLHRDRAARPAAPPNLADLQAAATELQQLKAAQATDMQRAVAEAKAEALKAGRAEMLPGLVAARIAATSAGTITVEQAEKIVAPLNAAYFLDENGALSQTKVADYVSGLPAGPPPPAGQPGAGQPGTAAAPGPAQPHQVGGVLPNLGQGSTGGTLPSGADLGRAEAARRFGTQTQSGSSRTATTP